MKQSDPKFVEQFKPDVTKMNLQGPNSVQYLFEFPNGYGASVVQSKFSYGGRQGLWELAVLYDRTICYDTKITDDVIGYLGDNQVTLHLERISALPPKM